jgi:hypothetical protein
VNTTRPRAGASPIHLAVFLLTIGFTRVTACAAQAVWRERVSEPVARGDNGWVATIPFADDGDPFFIAVRLSVAGKAGWWLIDTGMRHCAVASSQALRMGIVQGARLPIRLPSGVAIPCDSVSIQEMDSWTPDLRRPISGVLGGDVFSRFVVQIDYAAHALRLYDPDRYRYAGRGDTLALRFDAGHPKIMARITDWSRINVGRELYLSTASGDGVNDSLVLKSTTQPRYEITTSNESVHGSAIEGTLARVEFGHSVLTDVPSTADGPGIVGAAVWRQFTCVIDYRHRRMFIEPNEFFGAPFDRGPRSGLTLYAESYKSTPTVASVIPGSPADVIGIRAGDVIVELDGQPAVTLGVKRVEYLLNRFGNAYRLVLRRGGREIVAELRV